jgi:hypothetical protein
MTSNIHPSLTDLAVDLDTLTPDPRNARAHDERNIRAVMESFRDHGQLKPVVVQRRPTNSGAPDYTPTFDYVVRAGNASCEAARRLGWKQVAAVVIETSDADAIKFALRDNRTAELAEWDLPNLGAEMRVLQAEGVALESLGWDEFEYKPLIAAEWEPANVSGEDFNVPDKRVGVMFSRDQFEALKMNLGAKPTAEAILERLGVKPA